MATEAASTGSQSKEQQEVDHGLADGEQDDADKPRLTGPMGGLGINAASSEPAPIILYRDRASYWWAKAWEHAK